MAGEAKTAAFMLSSATIMIGACADMWDLNPTDHSIGLVKNFQVSATPTFLDLMHGARGSIVYTTMTANPVKASCEVFEYTSKNLTYGLGLDGVSLSAYTTDDFTTVGAITGSTSPGVITTTFSDAADQTASFVTGTWISIQDSTTDAVHYAKLSIDATVTGAGPYVHTLTFTGYGVKTGTTYPAGSRISRVNRISVGSTEQQVNYSAKIVGILPDDSRPVGLVLPKVRITRGFNLAFTTDNYGNMPFEFQPLDLLVADPFYSEFYNRGPAALFMST